MSRLSVLSGQIFGKVDWVTADGREIGMFLKTSDREASRCVLAGPDVERMVANNIVQKGMMVTAHGEFHARSFTRRDDGKDVGEVVCTAQRLVAEAPREGRLRGAIYANMKGVVMHWDANTLQLKTFFNYTEPGKPKQVTCSIHMRNWLAGMTPDGQQHFKDAMRVGREFVTAALLEVSCYRNREGVVVPALMLLPTDFKLQG
ncbi:hypothetical protein G3A43_07675 [Paraburkholderia aspalathi]|nr:hypothetical protein [Paraburkholderia aspalathi]MBK3780134.1 hypothetical protein [Paraburkholderia aspalathi]